MKANVLLKHNIDTLLRARGQTRRELAIWCRQSLDKKVDAWISHIFTRPDQGIQLRYLDRIADFFGIAVYQLFQPGISPLTERRTLPERRSGTDRRITAKQLGATTTPQRGLILTADDEVLLADLHALSYEKYQHVRAWIVAAKLARNTAPDTKPHAAPAPEVQPPTAQSLHTRAAPMRKRKKPPK